MPTLRLVYLTEHQYQHAFVTPAEDETNNTTAAELPTATLTRMHEHSRFPVVDATRNASSNDKKPPAVGGEETMVKQEQSDDHEDDDDDYVDTLLQEAIGEVNTRTCSSGSQVPHDEMTYSDEESENESDSSPSLEFVDAVQQFQHEMISSDEESDHGDSASSPVDVDAIQQKSGNKRKRRGAPTHSFDDHFNDLMAFKAKYGHCDVSQYGEDASLGVWCSALRGSYKKIQNNQKPQKKLSDEQIQRLSDAGFKWFLQKRELTSNKTFDNRFNDLMAFKAKYGHCNVSQLGEDASLGNWCSVLRGSYKKMQHNQKPKMKLSDEQIQRLSDAGFKWFLQKKRELTSIKTFDDHFNDLMAFKAKYGHCNASQRGEDASLGMWCSGVRLSYKKMQNNQKPQKKLSNEQIQRLSDAGFKWFLQKRELTSKKTFDDRFNDLMAFKAKYGHCNVSFRGEDASLANWCCVLSDSYKKMQQNQKPKMKLSDEKIQRLSDAGFKWFLQKRETFDDRFNDLMAFKAKYGHCNVSFRGGDASLGSWCSALRVSYKKMQNNQKPQKKLSDEQIQRLSDAGFKWCLEDKKKLEKRGYMP
jgi:hypothetical protein